MRCSRGIKSQEWTAMPGAPGSAIFEQIHFQYALPKRWVPSTPMIALCGEQDQTLVLIGEDRVRYFRQQEALTVRFGSVIHHFPRLIVQSWRVMVEALTRMTRWLGWVSVGV